MLNIYFLLQIVLISALAFFKPYWLNNWFISAFMILYQILYVFSSIGIFATAMQCCWKKVSATQFTLYMTMANMGRIAGAKLIGPIKHQFNWQYTLFAFGIMIAAAWVILQFVHISNHVHRVTAIAEQDERDTTTAFAYTKNNIIQTQ